MTARTVFLFALAASTTAAAGCGGARTSALPPPAPDRAASAGTAAVQFSVVIPHATSAAQRRALHLPSSTQSLVVTVSQSGVAGQPQTIDTTPASPGCAVSGSNLVCSSTVLAPLGADVFDVTAWDAIGGKGNELSHGSVGHTIAPGVNAVPISLGGIVKSLTIVPSAPLFEGTSSSGQSPAPTAGVVATDADGNTILGTFDQPVSGITGSGVFAGTSGSFAASTDTIPLQYAIPDPSPANAGSFSAAGGITVQAPRVTLVTDIANGAIAAWYDADDAATIVPGATFTWNDRANGLAVTQTTAAAQPATGASINGASALQFAPGHFLARADGFPLGDYTVFVVAAEGWADSTNGTGNVLGGGLTVGAGHSIGLTGTADGVRLCLYEGVSCASAPNATANFDVPNGNPVKTHLNSQYRIMAMVSGTQGGAPTATLTLDTNDAFLLAPPYQPHFRSGPVALSQPRGADPSIVVNGYGGAGSGSGTDTIGEIVILNRAATPAEQAEFAAYFQQKWKLQ